MAWGCICPTRAPGDSSIVSCPDTHYLPHRDLYRGLRGPNCAIGDERHLLASCGDAAWIGTDLAIQYIHLLYKIYIISFYYIYVHLT